MFFLKKKVEPNLRLLFTIAGGVLLLKVLFLILTPMRGIASTTWIIDDSFIEMRVARNIALGYGFSLDQVHLTTGAPFLWMYLSSLMHFLPGGINAAIRGTLILSSVFGTLATLVVFFLSLKLTDDRRVAWTAFVLSTFTANAFCNAMNGMETSFFTLFVLLSFGTALGLGKPKNCPAFLWGCVTGAALGVTVMTRGDGLFVLAAVAGLKVWEIWKAPIFRKKDHVLSLLGILLVAGACFAFFMTWQLVQTGSPLPGNQVGRRGLSLALHGFSFDHFSWHQYLPIVVWNVFQLEELLAIATGGTLLVLAAFALGLLQKRLRPLAVMSAIYLGIFFTLLVAYQWYFPDLHGLRYLNPAAHLGFIFVAAMLWHLPFEAYKKTAVIVISICIAVLASYKHYQINSRLPSAPFTSYVGQPDKERNDAFWGTVDWVAANLPPGTLIGVRDYGRISMFTDARIQDLAGNIDPDVAVALRNGTLKDYLQKRGVNYLVIPTTEQRSDELYKYLHTHLNLQLVPGAPRSFNQNLYRIMW